MSDLSRRGRALVESPPLAPYIMEHFVRQADAWDPQQRPRGYIPLCIAENKLTGSEFRKILAGCPEPPQSVLGYDAMIGNLEFRTNLAAFMSRAFLGRSIAAEDLAVVAGAGTVLELLFYAIADPGEGVLVPTPSYAGFWADLETRDALRIVPVHCRSDDGFTLTTAQLDRALDEADCKIRALLFTTPNNPLGRVYSAQELEAIVRWGQRRSVHVVFDEIYALSVFGEQPFVSAASLRPSLGEHVHLIWAFSKDFGASGLRCGVLVSEDRDVIAAVDGLAYWSACSGHTQSLLSSVVSNSSAVDPYIQLVQERLRGAYQTTSDALLAESIRFQPAQAGFFVICDLRAELDSPTWEAEDRLWRRMLDEANVNLTPGHACRICEPGFFRLCYAAVPPQAVREAIGRLGRLFRGQR